jgi:hypothetical protein
VFINEKFVDALKITNPLVEFNIGVALFEIESIDN